jgi:hypothetical protein
VPQATHNSWVFAGTGMKKDVPVKTEAVGYEIDNFDTSVARPAGTKFTLLSASPFRNFQGHWYIQNSSIYLGPGKNWVWATGSMDWSWTLTPGGSSHGQNNVRKSTQVMTVNILNHDRGCAGSRLTGGGTRSPPRWRRSQCCPDSFLWPGRSCRHR